jgi:hypothetical protein
MSPSFPSPGWPLSERGPAAWLPPFGHGNGLHAPTWAPIADVDGELVDDLLAAFAEAGVPAYASPVQWPSRRAGTRRNRLVTSQRLWVGSMRYATAEDVLRIELPRLAARHGEVHRG